MVILRFVIVGDDVPEYFAESSLTAYERAWLSGEITARSTGTYVHTVVVSWY